MAKIKTKDDLLEMLEKCLSGGYLLKTDPKLSIIEKYRTRIKDTLSCFDKKTELYDLPDDVDTSYPEKISIKTESEITEDLFTVLLTCRFSKGAVSADKDVKRFSRGRDIVFWITISIVVVVVLAMIVLAFIQWGEPKKEFLKWDWIACVGIVDCIIGTIGFVTERVLDRKKSKAEDVVIGEMSGVRQYGKNISNYDHCKIDKIEIH